MKQGKEKTESENKMEEVIKLISDTEALGDKNRESILNRIREIIPIGQIGSKELKLLE